MTGRGVLAKLEKTCGQWQAALEGHDEGCFTKAAKPGAWTLGQVCDHVTRASRIFLDSAQALCAGVGETHSGSLFTGLTFGVFRSLPPLRFRVPADLPEEFAKLEAPDPMTRAAAQERFAAILDRTRGLCEGVNAAPRSLRSNHPAAGWLNALQWYQLSEMHMRHHLRQLRRLEKTL